MTEIQITTTQNVSLSFKPAGLNYRILAWLIDVLVKIAYIGVIGYLFFGLLKLGKYLDSLVADYWTNIAILILLLLPVIFYTLVLETLLGGQTIGKKIIKIKILKIDGCQTGFLDFFIRWVTRVIDVSLFSGIIALIFIGSSKKGQRLGGIASGTVVVDLRNKVNISHTILDENLEDDYKPIYPTVIKLSDNDVRIIKEYFIKAKNKNDHGLLLKLKQKIVMVIGQEPSVNITAKDFITTVLKDYNFITQNM